MQVWSILCLANHFFGYISRFPQRRIATAINAICYRCRKIPVRKQPGSHGSSLLSYIPQIKVTRDTYLQEVDAYPPEAIAKNPNRGMSGPQIFTPILAKYVQTSDSRWGIACIALKAFHEEMLKQVVTRKWFRQFDSQITAPGSILLPNLFGTLERLDHHTGPVAVAFAHLGVTNDILPVPSWTMRVRITRFVINEIPYSKTDRLGLVE